MRPLEILEIEKFVQDSRNKTFTVNIIDPTTNETLNTNEGCILEFGEGHYRFEEMYDCDVKYINKDKIPISLKIFDKGVLEEGIFKIYADIGLLYTFKKEK